jgi:hypothetical protein
MQDTLDLTAFTEGYFENMTKSKGWPGMVVHICNPSTWEAKTGGS